MNRFEPEPPKVASAPPPDWFREESKRYWYRIVPMLALTGVLTEADLPLLERYCDFLADWREVRDFLAKAGEIFYPIKESVPVKNKQTNKLEMVERTKYLQEFPHVSKKLKISEHLLRIEQHFGMTPAARTRIMIEPPQVQLGTAAQPQAPQAEGERDPFDPFEPPMQ